MLKIRTTKEVRTSLHNEETHLLEFRYTYDIKSDDEVFMKTDTYRIMQDDLGNEYLELITGASSYLPIKGDDLNALLTAAESITPHIEGETILQYFNRLTRNGIKIYIQQHQRWCGLLTIEDFEA